MSENNKNRFTAVNDRQASAMTGGQGKGHIRRFFTAVNSRRGRIATFAAAILAVMITDPITAYAEEAAGMNSDMSAAGEVIGSAIGWVGRIGLAAAFAGIIMFVLAIRHDDADAKIHSMMTIASGLAVFALTLTAGIFGIAV